VDFSFTEEQSMLRDTVASYLADHYDFDKRRAAVSKEPGWRPEVWKAFAEELGIPMQAADLSRHDIYTADECFLTGTAAEVIAAVKYDQRIIGTGTPGHITQRVITRFREIAGSTGTAF
jgi:hypothetical protein